MRERDGKKWREIAWHDAAGCGVVSPGLTMGCLVADLLRVELLHVGESLLLQKNLGLGVRRPGLRFLQPLHHVLVDRRCTVVLRVA